MSWRVAFWGIPIELEMEEDKKVKMAPREDQLSDQNRTEAPDPTFTLIQRKARSRRPRSFFTNHGWRCLGFIVQKVDSSPPRISWINQTTQIEPEDLKSSHISFIEQALFQALRSLQPRPPSSLESIIVSQATFAECAASEEPCHKNELQREFIFVMQALGKMKVEVQKLVMPFMTVLRRRSLPA